MRGITWGMDCGGWRWGSEDCRGQEMTLEMRMTESKLAH